MWHKRKIENTDFHFIHDDALAKYIKTDVVEEMYDAKYLGEFCTWNRVSGWVNKPVQLYYTEEPHPQGSNYFILHFNEGLKFPVISDGINCVFDRDGFNVEYTGVFDPDIKEVLYSAYRHDYQVHEQLMCDGGRDYTRSSTHPRFSFIIEKDKFYESKNYIPRD